MSDGNDNAEFALSVDPRMYFKFTDGWAAHVKQTWEKQYCYGKFPGEEYHHLLLKGEIFVQRDDEKLCLSCALRRGHLTFDRLHWQRHEVPELSEPVTTQ